MYVNPFSRKNSAKGKYKKNVRVEQILQLRNRKRAYCVGQINQGKELITLFLSQIKTSKGWILIWMDWLWYDPYNDFVHYG